MSEAPKENAVTVSIFDRTNLANITATVLIIGGMAYSMYKGDVDTVRNLALIGVGYLLKSVVAGSNNNNSKV